MTSLNLNQENVERLIEIMDFQDKLNSEIRLILDGKPFNNQNPETVMELEPERREKPRKCTFDEIKAEIKDYLDGKGTKEASLKMLYPHFKSIFTDISNFRKACTELGWEGYKIWQ